MSDRWARVNNGGRLLLEWIDSPDIETIEHEQEHHSDKPQIGEATLFFALQFLLGDLHEAVDEGGTGAISLKKA